MGCIAFGGPRNIRPGYRSEAPAQYPRRRNTRASLPFTACIEIEGNSDFLESCDRITPKAVAYRIVPDLADQLAAVLANALAIADGHLMRLEGDCRALFRDLQPDEALIKVGISNSTSRRRSELNGGFPPGAAMAWSILREKAFENGAVAYAVESRCLERLPERKHWMGGEVGRLGSDALSQLIEEFWSGRGG